MGANAHPSGSLGGPHRHPSPAAVALRHGLAASTAAALRHDPGLAMHWSPEEQAVLDDGLAKYALDAAIVRYAKIALRLPNKTVRDVALRCRWMTVTNLLAHFQQQGNQGLHSVLNYLAMGSNNKMHIFISVIC